MEINLSERVKKLIAGFLLIILPLLFIGVGAAVDILNAWYFILSITWFGLGIIFFNAIY
jgi:hypothetical protein